MNLERIYSMKKQNAFTLAEVLITLGIIGVVAAMTMPSLLNATQGKQYVTAYKRALAVMSQAGVMNYALDDTDFNNGTAYNILANRMNVVKTGNSGKTLYFNDGIAINFTGNATGCTDPTTRPTNGVYTTFNGVQNACKAIIDVNGDKGPTTTIGSTASGKEQYTVYFTKQGIVPGDSKGANIIMGDKQAD